MASPAPALIEAITSALGTWRPVNAREMLAFLNELPNVFESTGDALSKVFDACKEAGHFDEESAEAADELTGLLDDTHDKAIDLYQVFREENEFWLEGGA